MATFKVYHGHNKPLTAQGVNQVHALQFAAQYPGWHSIGNNTATKQAIAGLLKRKSIFVNEFNQFTIAYLQFR